MEFKNAVEKIDWKSKNKLINKYNQIDENLPREKYLDIKNCHLGQRKLLLTEIIYYNKLPKHSIIVYSGSAPGIHTDNILELYPTFNFNFVDPNYHNMKYPYEYIYKNGDVISPEHKKKLIQLIPRKRKFCDGYTYDLFDKKSYGTLKDFTGFNKRIYVIQDYMTPELADKLFKLLGKVYHVCDLRTSLFEQDKPNDADILHNSALVYLINRNLKPITAFLKFVTPPYANRKDDFIEKVKKHDYIKETEKLGFDFIKSFSNGEFPFYDGKIYIQPWGGTITTETRLYVKDFNSKKIYNILGYRGNLNYISIYRKFVFIPKYYDMVKHLNIHYDGCKLCHRNKITNEND